LINGDGWAKAPLGLIGTAIVRSKTFFSRCSLPSFEAAAVGAAEGLPWDPRISPYLEVGLLSE
jgi:hypothetical protein